MNEVEAERSFLDAEAMRAKLEGERRTVDLRIKRLLANNRAALNIVRDAVNAKKMDEAVARDILNALAPGGVSKFKAVAKLVGKNEVYRKRSMAGGAAAGKDSCAQQL